MSIQVTFLPDGQSISIRSGSVLLKGIQAAGRPIGYSCRGQGICIACAIWVSGTCNAIGPQEEALLATLPGPNRRDSFQRRIGCLVRAEGHVQVTTDYW